MWQSLWPNLAQLRHNRTPLSWPVMPTTDGGQSWWQIGGVDSRNRLGWFWLRYVVSIGTQPQLALNRAVNLLAFWDARDDTGKPLQLLDRYPV